MKIPARSYIIFGATVFLAAFGVAQVWSAATTLLEGNWNAATTVTLVIGMGVIAVSAIVIGRILYVFHHTAIATADVNPNIDEVENV